MKKRTRFLITAVVLLAAMLMQSFLTVSVFAAETGDETEQSYEYEIPLEIIPEENVERYGHKERFYLAEEGMNEIRILNEDGTVSAYTFGYPVKYVDDDGITKDKSNKLHESKRNNYLYVNDDNDIKTYFPKKITKKPIIIDKNGLTVEIGIVTNSIYSKKGVVTEDNYVFYEQAFGKDTAIQYKPDFNGYKEEIILYNEKAPTSYSFEIKCEDMYILKENGILNFYSEFTDEVMFTTDPFYIYDSSEDVNSYVETEYTVTKTDDNEYLLTVSLNEEYLGTEGLTYPVYVDPAFRYNNDNTIDDVAIYSALPNTNCGTDTVAYVGYDASLGVCRFLMRFNDMIAGNSLFNALETNEFISAHLYVYNVPMGEQSASVRMHQFSGAATWTESNATWNSIGVDVQGDVFGGGALSCEYERYVYFDVTSVVERWKSDVTLAQKGIILVNTKEGSTDTTYKKAILTSNHSLSLGPYMLINYTQIIPDGTYYIQNRKTKMYMETEGRSTTVGAAIQQGAFKTSNPAMWEIKRQYDGYYSIKSVVTGRYIGVESAATTNNAQILQYQAYSKDDTKWAFAQSSSGNWVITAKKGALTNVVLSLPTSSESDGTNLVQYSYTNDENYRDEWMIRVGNSSLGALSHWYIDVPVENGDIHTMGMWGAAPKIFISANTSNTIFMQYVTAILQQLMITYADEFNGATITNNSSSADIIINAVDELAENNLSGKMIPSYTGQAYQAVYQGQSKTILEFDRAEISVLASTNYSQLQNTILHELWHAFGYLGHSSNTSDVMYRSTQAISVSQLSQRDKDQIMQIYPLVYID